MVAELGEPSGPTLAATAGDDDDDDEVTVGGAEDGSKKPLPHQQEGKVSDPAQASVLGLVLFQWVRFLDAGAGLIPFSFFISGAS